MMVRRFPQVEVTLDSHLQGELGLMKALHRWIRADAYEDLKKWQPMRRQAKRHVLLLSDPQLSTAIGQRVAKLYMQESNPILLSGHVDEGSYAKKLLDKGKAGLSILPVHNSDEQYEMMKRANRFQRCVPVHTERKTCETVISL